MSLFSFTEASTNKSQQQTVTKLQNQTRNKCQHKLTTDHCLLPLLDIATLIGTFKYTSDISVQQKFKSDTGVTELNSTHELAQQLMLTRFLSLQGYNL